MSSLLKFSATLLFSLATLFGTPEVPGVRTLKMDIQGEWIGNGVCFSPYRHGQRPGELEASAPEVLSDLKLVAKHWGLLRTYELTPMVETELRLIREHKIPVRMLLGLWVAPEKTEADRARNEKQMADGIRMASTYPDIVLGLLVGNETQVEWTGNPVDPTVLIRYLRLVRSGVTQPVSTADDFNFWNKPAAKAIAAEIDFITLHMYAAWNGRGIEEAMQWTGGVYDDICARHPGKPVIIGETGWPTSHDKSKTGPGQEGVLIKAETNERNQASYLKQHYAWVLSKHVPTILFEAFDEDWKGSGTGKNPAEAEKHWGVFNEDRSPKSSFEALVRDLPAATRRPD